MSQQITTSALAGMSLADKLKGRTGLVLTVCFLILAGLGWLDYISGYELSFFVFYSAPIGLAAWYSGRWPAIAVALGATVAWLLADYFGGVKYSTHYLYYWNGTIHFLAFIINAVTIAKIKVDLDRRRELAGQLEAMEAALRALTEQRAACPSCGHQFDNPKAEGAAKNDVHTA